MPKQMSVAVRNAMLDAYETNALRWAYRDQLRITIGGVVATTYRGPIIVGFAPSYQV